MNLFRLAATLGWRNLWRNPRRSLITCSAMAVAYALLIALIGLMGGMRDQLLDNGTRLELGHLQIHDADYLPDQRLQDTIGAGSDIDVPRLVAALQTRQEVLATAPRVRGYGLVSTGRSSAGAQLLGIDPSLESRVTTMLSTATSGDESEIPAGSVLLGYALAQSIGAVSGTKVAVVAQAADGSLGNDLFRVAGSLRTGLSQLDRSMVLMRMKDLQQLLALPPGRIHELSVLIRNPMRADLVAAELNRSGLLPRNSVAQSWGQLAPQLKDYVGLSESLDAFLIFLVAFFSSLGVLNTMMMSVFERTREIGMLGALGTRPMVIVGSIVLESLSLVSLGLAAGFGLGTLMMLYLTRKGLDLSHWIGEVSILGARMDPVLRGSWAWNQVLWSALALGVAALIASFIAARKVAWMKPIEALQAPTAV